MYERIMTSKSDIIFRLAMPEDAQSVLDIYAPIVFNTSISFEETPPNEIEMRARIEKTIEKYPWIVATKSDSKILGYAYASSHRERSAYKWSVDVSVYVGEEFRGQNLGKKLYKELFKILQKQNYYRAFAGIVLPNEASICLHESMGFTRLGTYRDVGYKHNKWHDVGWWELTLKGPDLLPNAPLRLKEMPKLEERFVLS